MENKRKFEVKTPLGTLVAWAKLKEDDPEDFPGLYVDLITPNGDPVMLACVEYETVDKVLQTRVYGDLSDDSPTHVVKYDLTQLEEE